MPWLPSFLNWQSALIGTALAVPALLLLYFLKLKRRQMPVSSTLLWKKAIQDLQVNAPFQKLRRNLLLLLQLLVLLLLLLALSRPVTNYKPSPGKITVILIDRSASMSAVDSFGDKGDQKRTRLEEAKRRAKDLVDRLGKGDSAAVIAFDDAAETVCPFTADAGRLKSAIDGISPTDRSTKLQMAFRLAEAQATFVEAQLRANESEVPDAWLFSDGKVLDADKLTIKAKLHYDPVGTDKLSNVAIVSLSARRNYEQPTKVQVFTRLANFGPEPVSADVQLSIDGKVEAVAAGPDAAFLYPESWNESRRQQYADDLKKKNGTEVQAKSQVDFPSIDLTTAAVVRIEQMRKEGDALSADDFATVVVPPPKNLSVLLVTEGNFFLEKALASLPLQKPDIKLPSEYEKLAEKGSPYDVIIFDRYAPKWMPPAGNFMYFGVVPAGIKVKVEREGDAAATTGPATTGPANPANNFAGAPLVVKDVNVLDWKRDHPILRNLQLGKIFVGEALKLKVPPECETLIEGFKGPLVALDREGRSIHLIVGFDALLSNWPLKVSFPNFINNALNYLAVGSDMDVRESYAPGATPKIPRANLQQAVAAGAPALEKVTLHGPPGFAPRELKIAAGGGDVALPALDKVGLYTLEPPVPGYDRIAVNLLDANESDLTPATEAPGKVPFAAETSKGGGKSRLELWWWIVACCALPLLLVEWWVYTRRVHL